MIKFSDYIHLLFSGVKTKDELIQELVNLTYDKRQLSDELDNVKLQRNVLIFISFCFLILCLGFMFLNGR